MKLPELIAKVKAKHLMNKETQNEVVSQLALLNSFGFDANTQNSRKSMPYLNRTMQNRVTTIRTFALYLNREAKTLEKIGNERLASHLDVAARFLGAGLGEVLSGLEEKERKAVERSYATSEVQINSKDNHRYGEDRSDDEKALVAVKDLYDIAAFAIQQCTRDCDGTPKQCNLRDTCITLRIPINYSYLDGICPYWNETIVEERVYRRA